MIVATPRYCLTLLALLLLAACDVVEPAAAPPPSPTRVVPTLFPTSFQAGRSPPSTGNHIPGEGTPAPVPSGAADVPDTGWLTSPRGIELRRLRVVEAPDRPAIPLTVVRLDPARVRLQVAYAPDQPRSLRSWFAGERPLVAINGSFFREDHQTAALLVSDGVASGASYAGFGGMLAVAPGGAVSIRPLRDQPYDPGEELDQALQSFPMLVFPGGEPAQIEDDGQRARRSAIALDRAGRLLLIACPTNGFTLRGLADWLSHSDLDVDRALNLDGGSSTGLFVQDGEVSEAIDSFGLLPIVLLVEPKSAVGSRQ